MKNKKPHWGVPVLMAFLGLLLAACVLPPLSKPKARASGITEVNNFSSFSMTSTNAPATAAPNK